MPLISVIIPVYNTEKYLKECLDSVIAQTVRDIEIICVDDGSTDGSLSVLREYEKMDERVIVVAKENGGVVSARKAGIVLASGEFLSFVDSDDTIDKEMLEKMLKKIENADVICCGVSRQITKDKIVVRVDNYDERTYAGEDYEKLIGDMLYDFETLRVQNMTPWMVNKLFRKSLVMSIINKLGEGLRYAEDSVFLYTYILQCNSIGFIKETLYFYRFREDSAIHKINKEMLIDINEVYLALESEFRAHRLADVLLPQLQRWIAMLTCNALNGHMGLDKENVYIPEFQIDSSDLKEKKIVIYGAGKCGQDVHRQLIFFGYRIVGWVDQDYSAYQLQGYEVQSPDRLNEMELDVILIAVGNKGLAECIKNELLSKGIREEKIIWKIPRHIY